MSGGFGAGNFGGRKTIGVSSNRTNGYTVARLLQSIGTPM
jgi:hypothetical protein